MAVVQCLFGPKPEMVMSAGVFRSTLKADSPGVPGPGVPGIDRRCLNRRLSFVLRAAAGISF
jgi:hypothetical protein